MVKKILVKQNASGVQPNGSSTAVHPYQGSGPYPDGASYKIDYAGHSEHVECVTAASEIDSASFEFVEDLQIYDSEDNVICGPDVVLAEQEVEVAAYATLAADSRPRAVPAVVLEANMCPMGCGTTIRSENHLRGHLKGTHGTPIVKEIKQFQNMGSFLSWKEARERESSRRYVVREKRQGWRRFSCSRSGQPSGTDRPQCWKRTGNFCPAFIRTTTLADGSVKARFSLLHTCRQPDNSTLPSDRELVRANQQLDLLERAVLAGQPRRRRKKRKWGDQYEPGRRPADPGAATGEGAEPPQDGRQQHPMDEVGPFPASEVTVSSADRWPRQAADGDVTLRQAPSAAARKASALPEAAAPGGGGGGDGDGEAAVKHRVRTNLLRLHTKLERATAEEARQLLADTEQLLERHTRLRQRGTTGRLDRRRGQPKVVSVDGQQYGRPPAPAVPAAAAAAGPVYGPSGGGAVKKAPRRTADLAGTSGDCDPGRIKQEHLPPPGCRLEDGQGAAGGSGEGAAADGGGWRETEQVAEEERLGRVVVGEKLEEAVVVEEAPDGEDGGWGHPMVVVRTTVIGGGQ